ncbi:hypothetical protein L0U85_01780 [Glycomyces sp. L485]|uniref:hypothetical protein n=1 Tax=Glycomyces sp. L485 TaxID=2909235 RepID=UPI001F4B4577|nr:hypothetical protein [Glycomyces sp. L485]MCH7229597.1 hypothetical protein [Glycomyces sp. L485]
MSVDCEPTIKERVAASRAAQGLPPVITDPAAIERVAAILLAAEAADGNRADAAGPPSCGGPRWP